jgi:hypothetical protein
MRSLPCPMCFLLCHAWLQRLAARSTNYYYYGDGLLLNISTAVCKALPVMRAMIRCCPSISFRCSVSRCCVFSAMR